MNFEKYHNNDESFREDALKAVGLWGHPEADKLYSLAWKNGWEGGYEEVFEHLWDLADMTLNPVSH